MANRSRILRLAAVAPLVITMTVLGAPTGGAVDKPQGGTLVLASGSGVPGVAVSLRGRIPTDQRTRVELQRLDHVGLCHGE